MSIPPNGARRSIAGAPAIRSFVSRLRCCSLHSMCRRDFLDPQQMPAFDAETFDAPLQPGAHLGGFLVLRAIGSGGMGIVYAAQQDRPRRTVAFKVLRRSARRREVMKRFELEAEVLGRLQHPGIAQVQHSIKAIERCRRTWSWNSSTGHRSPSTRKRTICPSWRG
jgi:serine/threonine protein kinase